MSDAAPYPVKLRTVETPEQKILRRMEIDLHGYHPRDIDFENLLRQVWETGVDEVVLVHGHGRMRAGSRRFRNTKTGYFGVHVRRTIRGNSKLKPWVKISMLDVRRWGETKVRMKQNPNSSRSRIDMPASSKDPAKPALSH
jgi:hypothetical protein